MALTSDANISASFRDPSGFLFRHQNVLYRQVNRSYSEHYDLLMSCGLYSQLVEASQLIAHEESPQPPAEPGLAYKVIKPTPVGFISYPYEWCFSQLRDAALLTLHIQQAALDKGMTLKDCSAFNVQFHRGRPVFIDTLSFERYAEGEPWIAYRQFCQHFLAPLALMSYTDVRLSQFTRIEIDGVPLDLAARLLPWRTRLRLTLLIHIHLHARAQRRYSDTARAQDALRRHPRVSRLQMMGLIDNLASAVGRLHWQPAGTPWGDYYDATNYTDESALSKKAIIETMLEQVRPARVWDLGGNTGLYSRLATARGIPTSCFDVDPAAVEKNYRQCVREKNEFMLPLLCDLTNPSPSLGWHHRERQSLLERGPADLAMALALVHHLAIANNVPLAHVAKFLADACRALIIEFVPKEDSQVQRLLATRPDIFPDYHGEGFERAFERYFRIERAQAIAGSRRRLYLMRNKALA